MLSVIPGSAGVSHAMSVHREKKLDSISLSSIRKTAYLRIAGGTPSIPSRKLSFKLAAGRWMVFLRCVAIEGFGHLAGKRCPCEPDH